MCKTLTYYSIMVVVNTTVILVGIVLSPVLLVQHLTK